MERLKHKVGTAQTAPSPTLCILGKLSATEDVQGRFLLERGLDLGDAGDNAGLVLFTAGGS
jgi:hypothetical protein